MIEVTPHTLRAALAVERWVADVAAAGPFDTVDSLLRVASAAATPLATDEIDEAIAHHPRIGEKPAAGQTFSAAEQGANDPATDAAIAAGNAAYESRFGRVFIIRAAGRSRAQILAELPRRLELDDDTELAIVGEQLRDIALLRLEKTFA
ncbi:2-oxo-4-hydroxy-4-carboxy-5-ureidoimidazoline decarboxylase [soil metagenome]